MKKTYRSLFCLLAVLLLSVSVLPSAAALSTPAWGKITPTVTATSANAKRNIPVRACRFQPRRTGRRAGCFFL